MDYASLVNKISGYYNKGVYDTANQIDN